MSIHYSLLHWYCIVVLTRIFEILHSRIQYISKFGDGRSKRHMNKINKTECTMVMLKVSAILYLLLALVALVFLSIAQYSHDVPPPVYLDSPSNVELLSFSKRRTATTSGGSIGTIKRKQKYQLAYDESLGYFDDLDETHWERLREAAIARLQSIRTYRPKMMDWMTPMSFYEYFEPDFVCPFERRLGSNEIGDGPKW
jgi:hypothetical protein